MLKSLTIKNYALITYVHIDFDIGLNIITGETGAGKSILLGALGLILGKRADLGVVQYKDEKCFVEGVFHYKNESIDKLLEEYDLENADSEIIIRREISPQGKSRAFINDTPVNLDIIQAVTTLLIDIHAQHETQSIAERDFFIPIIDAIAHQSAAVKVYQEIYTSYKKNISQYQQLSAIQVDRQQQKEFLEFQYEELNAALTDTEDYDTIEEELQRLEHATTIQEWIAQVQHLIFEDENNFSDSQNQLTKLIAQINAYTKNYDNFFQLLEQLRSELKPLQRQLQQDIKMLEADPERISILRAKQTQINKLLLKHHIIDIQGLRALFQELQQSLSSIETNEDLLALLMTTIEQQQNELLELAHNLSERRCAVLQNIEAQINALVVELGMPYGKIMMQQKTLEQVNALGIDEINLLFAPNKGSRYQSLETVGSGGEKSRLMLAIKSIAAQNMALPTLIFDEIDTGISGQVAIVVGDLLKRISREHQIIAVTHLPQVAAKGSKHLYVFKDHSGELSKTLIQDLDEEAKIENIAAMLSGDNITDAAKVQAKHLMEN